MTSAKAKEALQNLHRLYVKKLPQEMSALEHLWSEVDAGGHLERNVLRDMLLATHSLNGSGATYGLLPISEAFAQLEDALHEIQIEGELEPQKKTYVDVLLGEVREAIEHEVSQLPPDEEGATERNDRNDRQAQASPGKNFVGRLKPLILIVDDTEGVRRRLRVVLEDEGFQVIEAEDGYQGLEQAKAHRPDLVLLDVRMPDRDGFEVQRLIRAEETLRRTAILFLTAAPSISMAEIQTALSYGVEGYLSKTMPMADIVKKARATLVASV